MPKENIEAAEQPPVEPIINGLSRTELNQTLANHLSAYIAQRSAAAESRQPTTRQRDSKEASKYGSYVAWSIGVIATGGGIYLETIGQKRVGTTLLVADGLACFNPVYSSIMGYIDRRRAIRKNGQS